MNESESLGLHSYNEPSDPLSAREAAGEERREQFSLAERLNQCPYCLGIGYLYWESEIGRVECPRCKGTGKKIAK